MNRRSFLALAVAAAFPVPAGASLVSTYHCKRFGVIASDGLEVEVIQPASAMPTTGAVPEFGHTFRKALRYGRSDGEGWIQQYACNACYPKRPMTDEEAARIFGVDAGGPCVTVVRAGNGGGGPIAVGTLARISSPRPCCDYAGGVGRVGTVLSIRHKRPLCTHCGQRCEAGMSAWLGDEIGFVETYRLEVA